MDEMVLNIITIALMVESIVLHEVAHGWVAGFFGDRTARLHGRITMNPIPHIDPVWTIVVPVVAFLLSAGSFIIGGAKPVPVNPLNFKKPVLGDVCVSVAGVVVNLFIAILLILLINVVLSVSGVHAGVPVITVMLKAALLNIVLALFNLIPIPPLDGSHLFKYLLPPGLRAGYVNLGRTGTGFILLILLINVPGVWNVFSVLIFNLRDLFLKSLIF